MDAKILQWPKQPKPRYTEQDVLFEDPKGGVRIPKKLHTNPITSKTTPTIILDDTDIAGVVLGVVSCSASVGELDWTDYAYVLTTHGVMFMRGIKWHDRSLENGYTGYTLPIRHFQKAAAVNYGMSPIDPLRKDGQTCMESLKKYCEYVCEGEKLIYEQSIGLLF